jgi:hypothetical protein
VTRVLGEAGEYALSVLGPGSPYNVAGDGMPPVWVADVNVDTANLVHVGYVPDPATSPLVEGSSAPAVVRQAAVVDLLAVFGRYREVIENPDNPIRGVHIITNRPEVIPAVSFLHNEAGCPGAIEVRDG